MPICPTLLWRRRSSFCAVLRLDDESPARKNKIRQLYTILMSCKPFITSKKEVRDFTRPDYHTLLTFFLTFARIEGSFGTRCFSLHNGRLAPIQTLAPSLASFQYSLPQRHKKGLDPPSYSHANTNWALVWQSIPASTLARTHEDPGRRYLFLHFLYVASPPGLHTYPLFPPELPGS